MHPMGLPSIQLERQQKDVHKILLINVPPSFAFLHPNTPCPVHSEGMETSFTMPNFLNKLYGRKHRT